MPNQQNQDKSQGGTSSIKRVFVRTLKSDVASIKNQGGGRPRPYKIENQGGGVSTTNTAESGGVAPPPPAMSENEYIEDADKQSAAQNQGVEASFMDVWGGTIKIVALTLTALALMIGIYFLFFQ